MIEGKCIFSHQNYFYDSCNFFRQQINSEFYPTLAHSSLADSYANLPCPNSA